MSGALRRRPPAAAALWSRACCAPTASFIRVSHSVFALPFALVGALLAAAERPVAPIRVLWIVLAMVTARSAAMAFNRLVDARWDALNPRTANREIPTGKLSARAGVGLPRRDVGRRSSPRRGRSAGSASRCRPWRWRSCSGIAGQARHQLHAVLPRPGDGGGAGRRLAGRRRRPRWPPFWLALAIGTWVGGFDVLYACQDVTFDRAHGLRSIPVRFGVGRSLLISRALHVATVGCLLALGVIARSARSTSSGSRWWRCSSSTSRRWCARTICRRSSAPST